MADDLVERLRTGARTMSELNQAAHEAADEIDRLTAALAEAEAERDRNPTIAYFWERCNKLVHGECRTLVCVKRGGWCHELKAVKALIAVGEAMGERDG